MSVLTASQARTLSALNGPKDERPGVEFYLEEITQEAKAGGISVQWTGGDLVRLRDDVREDLIRRGFQVGTVDGCLGPSLRISWSDEPLTLGAES